MHVKDRDSAGPKKKRVVVIILPNHTRIENVHEEVVGELSL